MELNTVKLKPEKNRNPVKTELQIESKCRKSLLI